MFYAYHAGYCIQAHSIPAVLEKLPRSFKFNWNTTYLKALLKDGFWMTQDLYFQTHIQNIFRIPFGYQLVANTSGPPQLIRQWHLTHPQQPLCTEKEARIQLAEQLEHVIKHATNNGPIGVELSGGLDSSTVSAFTRQVYQDEPLHAFTHAVPTHVPIWMHNASFLHDEFKWSHRVSQHLGLTQHPLLSSFDLGQLIEQHAKWFAGCIEVLFPLLNHEAYTLAHKHGIKTLLSGFGGDEVVSQHANDAIPEWRAQGAYFRYGYERIMKQIHTPQIYKNLSIFPTKTTRQQPNSHWAYLHIDSPCMVKHATSYKTVQAKELAFIEGALSLHWQRRIEASKVIAQHYGIHYAFPLATPELMRFFHQLPSHYKRRHGYGRYLLRKTLKGRLPHAVIWRSDKAGATAPSAYAQLITQLPQCFLERVSPTYQGMLNSYVNLPKLRQLFEQGPTLDSAIIRLSITILMLIHYESLHENFSHHR